MFATEVMGGVEIYIPKKAEVKNITLGDLPKATLRKIKLHPSLNGSQYGDDLASVVAAWISPVAIREKGHSSANQPVDAANNCMALLYGIEQKAVEGPFPMPVVSSNTTAFNFLTHVFSSKSTEETKSPNLPFGCPLCHAQDAMIIFCGRVYLSVKKPMLNKLKRESHIICGDSPAPAPSFQQVSKSELLSLSPDAPESQRLASPPSPKRTAERSVTDRALLHRFGINRRLLVSLTKIPPGYMKGLLATRQQGQSRTKAHRIEEGSQEENGQIQVKDKRAKSSVGLQSPVVEQDGRLEETEDSFDIIQTTASESKVEQPHTGTDEASMDDTDRKEKRGQERYSAMDVDEPVNSLDVYAVGMVTAEEGDHGWTSNLPQVPAFSPSQGQEEDFDFELLAREEAISRIKAQLRESEAALSDVRDDDCSV